MTKASSRATTSKLQIDLGGRTALVTGGGGAPGRGMGRDICLGLAAAGANVVVVDINAETAEETARIIVDEGGKAVPIRADVSVPSDIAAMAETARNAFGSVDILVNHVGIGNHVSLLDTTDEWWDRCQAVNVRAPFLTARTFLPDMLAKGSGVIINTISVCGLAAGRAGSAYTASKHALVGLTKNIAACYADQGIRCVGIAPGRVRGDGPEWSSAENRLLGPEDQPELWSSLRQALDLSPRHGRPEEIAPAVVFLASDYASFINGAILPIDGGWTAI